LAAKSKSICLAHPCVKVDERERLQTQAASWVLLCKELD